MDAQNDSLLTDLQRADEMEQTLFRHLRGDEAIPRQETGALRAAPGAGAEYMLKERIGAWALLAAVDAVQKGPDASGIFVTASRSAAEYLTESGPSAVKVFEAADVPVDSGRSEISGKLAAGVAGTLDRSCACRTGRRSGRQCDLAAGSNCRGPCGRCDTEGLPFPRTVARHAPARVFFPFR